MVNPQMKTHTFEGIDLFAGAGGATDPVIEAAGRAQRALAGWVYRTGAWPWLLMLAALAAPAVFTLVARRRRRAR